VCGYYFDNKIDNQWVLISLKKLGIDTLCGSKIKKINYFTKYERKAVTDQPKVSISKI
jgi:hypothetical protein